MDVIVLKFEGYYEEDELQKKGFDCCGIYTVYAGKSKDNLRALIYIGESGDIENRLKSKRNNISDLKIELRHNKYSEWENELKTDEKLFFGFTEIDESNRKRVEAALIFEHQPICNNQHKESFGYPAIKIKTKKKNAHLKKKFEAIPK